MISYLKNSFLFLILLLAVLLSAGALPAHALPEADELIKKMHDAEAGLKSYSYLVRRKDLIDDAMNFRVEGGFSEHRAVIDKFSKAFALEEEEMTVPEIDKKEKHYMSLFDYMFVKPYRMQIQLVKSDYLPTFIQKSKMVFREEIDPAHFFILLPGSGMMMKRSTQEESGGFMALNWEYFLMEINCAMANGGKAVVSGTEKVMDRDTYILEVALASGREPYAVGCAGSTFGAPEGIHKQVNREFDMMAQRIEEYGGGIIRYNVDTKTHLIVQKEEIYNNNATGVLTLFDKIKLNETTVKDLMAPEVAGKKE